MQRSNALVVTRSERPSVIFPAIIGAHLFAPSDAAYLGAANFAAYLAGALLGRPLAARLPAPMLLRALMLLATVAFFACALLPHDVMAQQASWRTATTSFALMQATAAYGLTFVFTQTGGDYQLLFILGAGILITALGIDLAASVFPPRRRAA